MGDPGINFTEPVTSGSITHIERETLVPKKRNKVSLDCLAELGGAAHDLLLNPSMGLRQARSVEMENTS
jgi:hypothetical protein